MKAQGVKAPPCPFHLRLDLPRLLPQPELRPGEPRQGQDAKRPLSPGHVGPLQAECPSLLCCHHRHLPLDQRSGGLRKSSLPCCETGETKGVCANGASCCFGHSGGKTKDRSCQLQFWLLNSNPQAAQSLLEPREYTK